MCHSPLHHVRGKGSDIGFRMLIPLVRVQRSATGCQSPNQLAGSQNGPSVPPIQTLVINNAHAMAYGNGTRKHSAPASDSPHGLDMGSRVRSLAKARPCKAGDVDVVDPRSSPRRPLEEYRRFCSRLKCRQFGDGPGTANWRAYPRPSWRSHGLAGTSTQFNW